MSFNIPSLNQKQTTFKDQSQIKFYNDYCQAKSDNGSIDSLWQVSRTVSDNYALKDLRRGLNSTMRVDDISPTFRVNANNRSTLTNVLGQLESWNTHRKTIKTIQQSPVKPIYLVDPNQTYFRRQLAQHKEISKEFHTSKRLEENNKNNQHLLNHLLEIGKGKQLSLPRPTPRSIQLSSNLEKLSRNSYHFQTREKAQRIDTENRKLMERIISSAGTVGTIKELSKSYKKVKEYKRLHNNCSFLKNEMAERLLYQSQCLKDSVITQYMNPTFSFQQPDDLECETGRFSIFTDSDKKESPKNVMSTAFGGSELKQQKKMNQTVRPINEKKHHHIPLTITTQKGTKEHALSSISKNQTTYSPKAQPQKADLAKVRRNSLPPQQKPTTVPVGITEETSQISSLHPESQINTFTSDHSLQKEKKEKKEMAKTQQKPAQKDGVQTKSNEQKMMNSTHTQNFASTIQKDQKTSTQEVYTSNFEDDTQKTDSQKREPFNLKSPNQPIVDSTNHLSKKSLDEYEEDFN